MSPPDDDEIPPTEPAPAATPTERVPSMTGEDFDRSEAVTAVRCPHPPGLDAGHHTETSGPALDESSAAR